MTTDHNNKHVSNHESTTSLFSGSQAVIIDGSKKYNVELKEHPACTKACPAGVNVKAYVNLIANRRFEEAIEEIRKANPFPAVCGRVCTRPCEEKCEQGAEGDAVSIRALKRYASDYELARRPLDQHLCEQRYDTSVAIIGAGPAGLTTAVDLVRMGYPVEVFEAQQQPGGMLHYAIPPYRLPKRTVKREIDWIKGLGVKIHTKQCIQNPKKLLQKGFSAVCITTGAPTSIALRIKGEKANGVLDPLLFLNHINIDTPDDIKGKTVVVIGGGSTAFDAARSAVRLGATKVIIAYRRGIEEMPAETEEIQDAQTEGVHIQTLVIPKKIHTKNNTVHGLECVKAKLGTPDESGRRRPIPIKNSSFVIAADIIIPALGAKPSVGKIGKHSIVTSRGTVKVDEKMATPVQGVFAAGDVEQGPSSVVDAIGRGHRAASNIHAYLHGKTTPFNNMSPAIPIVTEPYHYTKKKYTPQRLKTKKRTTTFEEVEHAYDEYQAVEEASRCFTCGPCYLCSICLPNCSHKQLVGEINNTSFLLKVPLSLSEQVYQKNSHHVTLQSHKKQQPLLLQTLTATVDHCLCIGCGRCEEVCSYRAIRIHLHKGKLPVAEVNHDACASCSACVSVCPSGALSQGYMSDTNILARFQQKKTPYPGVKALENFWNTKNPVFDTTKGAIDIMDDRKISPSFLIRALARSGKGVLVHGPSESTGSHYLPWEENNKEILENTHKLLTIAGLSPHRISYNTIEKEVSTLLQEYHTSLTAHNLDLLKIPLPLHSKNPFSETIEILRIASANPDNTITDPLISRPIVKPGGIAFFEGCLPLLCAMGTAHKLFDLTPTRKALNELLQITNLHVGTVQELSCPSKGLLQRKSKSLEKIVVQIAKKNTKALKQAHPERLILGTPEAYHTFTKDTLYENCTSLPDELLQYLQTMTFSPINTTVALHHACRMNQDPFLKTMKQLLELIPLLTVIDLPESCGQTGFEQIDAHSKETSVHLINKVKEKGAEMIVCTSPYCQSHLLMCQREGSWKTDELSITDVYQLLLTSLQGDSP